MRILLVEDDLILVDVLTKSLVSQNYTVDTVSDGATAWDYILDIDYDLILLDVFLPNLDGVSLCRRLRAEQYETPILILTAQHENRARIRGLDAGADDYLVKPFDIGELLARIRALIRRSGRDLSPIFQLGQLVVDSARCTASYGGIPLSLSAKEYALLDMFFHEPQHVFSISELLDSLWTSEEYPAEATVRSHIRRLRNKLIDAGAPQDFISNVHGRGYFLKPEGERHSATSQASMIDEQQLNLTSESNGDLDAQYQVFLTETWQQFKPKGLSDLQQLAELLKAGLNSLSDIEGAKLLAHRLKGTLSLFNLQSAMQSAYTIESVLETLLAQNTVTPKQPASCHNLSQYLEIIKATLVSEETIPSPPQKHSKEFYPLILYINDDASLAQTILAAAEQLPLKLVIESSLDQVSPWLTQSIEGHQRPDGIIITLKGTQPIQRELEPLTELIHNNDDLYAPSILAIGNTIDFETRLQSVRAGITHLVEDNQSAHHILHTCLNLIHKPLNQAKTLIVDDDPSWLNAITRYLNTSGLQVTSLTDPQQFWPTLEATQPDIVILDIKMPVVNGLELCQALRSDTKWQALPIIVVSALTDKESKSSAFSVGADDYLCKPIQGADLAHRIETRLKRINALTQG